MKRDKRILNKLLLVAQTHDDITFGDTDLLNHLGIDEIAMCRTYIGHMLLLVERGLFEIVNKIDIDDNVFYTFRLTNKGHDYIELEIEASKPGFHD